MQCTKPVALAMILQNSEVKVYQVKSPHITKLAQCTIALQLQNAATGSRCYQRTDSSLSV
eukprot:1090-Heterococcus_DN1.PRE.1